MSEKKYPWNKRWKNDSGAENEVYAGPEYFERQLPEEPQAEEERRPMEGVYAGPPIPPPMMCTYAGPEFFNGTNTRQPMGASAPAAVTEHKKFCAECGNPVNEKDKFCTNCGAVLPREEK